MYCHNSIKSGQERNPPKHGEALELTTKTHTGPGRLSNYPRTHSYWKSSSVLEVGTFLTVQKPQEISVLGGALRRLEDSASPYLVILLPSLPELKVRSTMLA